MSHTGLEQMEQRIEELETRTAFQEDFIQQLNGIVTEQQQQIDMLARKSEVLIDRLKTMEGSTNSQAGPDHEIPPHY